MHNKKSELNSYRHSIGLISLDTLSKWALQKNSNTDSENETHLIKNGSFNNKLKRGYPFSRLRALYYAMGSLFFGVGVIMIISAGGVWTGGYSGLTGIHPMFAGSRVPYYYFFLGLALASMIALYRFEFCTIGKNLKAIAQSHLVASSVGINEGWYRILAVGMGCFFVGLVGAAYAHHNLVLSPTSFDLSATLWLVMYVLVGGINSFTGPIIGTAILVLIPEFFRGLKIYSPYISAGILLIVVYLIPQGLASLPQLMWSWYKERKKGHNRASLYTAS